MVMGFDRARHARTDQHPNLTDQPRRRVQVTSRSLADVADELRLRCRVRLLTLAGDLDDVGVRPRLKDTVSPPYVMRCWNPARQGPTLAVECGPADDDRLWFLDPESGRKLADAEEALEPGDTVDLAREIGRKLGTVPEVQR